MVIDAIYISKHLRSQPKKFKGFIKLEESKRKPEWARYVLIQDCYKEKINKIKKLRDTIEEMLTLYEPRFGYVKHESDSVDPRHLAHLLEDYHIHSGGLKEGLISKSLSRVNCYDLSSNIVRPRKCFFSNGEYVVRQAGIYEREEIKYLVNRAREENPGMFLDEVHSEKAIENYTVLGHIIVAVNALGELKGIQAFTSRDSFIEAEPFTYITEEARGQSIFAIYHEMSIDAGNAVNADYIYCRCNTSNDVMSKIYESYGYIKQHEIKSIGNRRVYQFKFPLRK